MGLKLELLLAVLIVTMLSIAYTVKLSDNVTTKKVAIKELEFTDTTFTEVDTEKLLSISFATFGIRRNGVLTVDNLIYHTDTIERLVADQGEYFSDEVYLNGHIKVEQKKGFRYFAEHAAYNKRTAVLTITSKFTAVMDRNIIHGVTGRYDSRKKVLFAKKVDAVLYTAEKHYRTK